MTQPLLLVARRKLPARLWDFSPIERRALAAPGTITCRARGRRRLAAHRPGRAGRLSGRHLAEVQDLTMAIGKSGYRVIFNDTAIA